MKRRLLISLRVPALGLVWIVLNILVGVGTVVELSNRIGAVLLFSLWVGALDFLFTKD